MLSKSLRFLRAVLPGVLPGLVCVLLLRLSAHYEYYELLGYSKPVEVPNLEYASLLVLWGLLCLPPRRWQPWVCMAVLALAQSVAFIDVNYYRFFRELPSLFLLPTWFQADEAGQSLSSVMDSRDAYLLLPLFVFLVFSLALRRLEREQKRSLAAAGVIVLAGAACFVAAWNQMHPVRYEQLQRRFQNRAIAGLFGIQFYHLYDLYEWTRVEIGAEGGAEIDEELIKRVIQDSRNSSTQKTPFKGRYEGRDFILIQLESLQYFAVDADYEGQPIMPFLRKARERAYNFKLFDQTHLGRSADGQFMFLNSLHPPATRPLPFAYPSNHFFALPTLFGEKGYRTFYFEPMDPSFWNSGILSKGYGFQERFFRKDLPPDDPDRDMRGWGLTDFALFGKVLKTAESCDKPYFMYVVTLMCHHPYSESSNTPVDFPPSKKLSMVRRYLRCCAARDRAVEELARKLAETPRGRKTVLCLVGDHDANLPTAEMNHEGYPVFPEGEAVPMILGSVEEILNLLPGEQKPVQPRFFGGQIDLAPTLGHVFSLSMEESVFVGWNLFATQNRGTLHCRLGTQMDQAGRIQESESSEETQQCDLFRVSEMLLQSDGIEAYRTRSEAGNI
ncbi:MAG: LTA synthase family protein [Candidatus Eremiobacteraeota bacterium]|nr:LTA synthase family protein [Candidatus Eremiobacteraeota bacterium]